MQAAKFISPGGDHFGVSGVHAGIPPENNTKAGSHGLMYEDRPMI